jgi:hypothetical protein
MKFIFKLIALFLFFIYSVLFFLPKDLIYNLFEKELEKQKIIISQEVRKEKSFSFVLSDAEVYFDGLQIADVKRTDISTLLFNNTIDIMDIQLSQSFSKIFPSKINKINIKHNITSYNKITIYAVGDFGEINGYINILDKKLYLNLQASALMKESYIKLLQKMKYKDGVYTYEYKL